VYQVKVNLVETVQTSTRIFVFTCGKCESSFRLKTGKVISRQSSISLVVLGILCINSLRLLRTLVVGKLWASAQLWAV